MRHRTKTVYRRARPKCYYDWTWGGPRRLREVAERIWRRGFCARWNSKLNRDDFRRWVRKRLQDPTWKARYEEGTTAYEAEMAEDDAIEESWHDDAYINDGPTPDWVRSLGDED